MSIRVLTIDISNTSSKNVSVSNNTANLKKVITVDTGTPGLSAYQVWLRQGNTGSEQEFFQSLSGEFAVSSDAGNKIQLGSDGGVLLEDASYGYLFSADAGNNQEFNTERTPLRINSGSVINQLKTPFTLDIINSLGIIQPRSVNDVYKILIRLQIVPTQINTDVTVELDIGGSFGVIESDRHRLVLGAGVTHLETFDFEPFVGSTFIANGGTFYVYSDAPVSVISADMRLYPRSIA